MVLLILITGTWRMLSNDGNYASHFVLFYLNYWFHLNNLYWLCAIMIKVVMSDERDVVELFGTNFLL